MPTAEFCASPTDNSTTFCILELGPHPWQPTFTTSAWFWLDLRLSLVLANSWLVCSPSRGGSLLSTRSELEAGNGLKLQIITTLKIQVQVFCAVFYILLRCKMWSVPQATEQMNGRNRHRQQTTIVLAQYHPPWLPGSCQS